MGSIKIHLPNPQYLQTSFMSSSQNVNMGTVVPAVVNPESVLVDSDPEEDLEEIQREVAAKQVQIKEAAQARLAVACKHIEKKWKAKEEEEQKVEEARKAEEACKVEEVWKVEEEEEQKWKEEEDQVVREKARKRQLEVHSSTSLIFVEN